MPRSWHERSWPPEASCAKPYRRHANQVASTFRWGQGRTRVVRASSAKPYRRHANQVASTFRWEQGRTRVVRATGIMELMPQFATHYVMPMSVSSRSSGEILEEYVVFGVYPLQVRSILHVSKGGHRGYVHSICACMVSIPLLCNAHT